MNHFYTKDRSTQIVLSLLKEHGIRKVIASPGTTNIALVASMQQDPFFEIFSAVDERSAAYMACGLSNETGEPVVLSCTGATASRNYMPALTEAYYRKLPILAITGSHGESKIGHLFAQTLDRTIHPNDIVKFSVNIPTVKCESDEWLNTININKAILELKRRGGGPVHINLEAANSGNFTVQTLPIAQKIDRITIREKFPELKKGRIAVFLGAHKSFSNSEQNALDKFCQINNAVVFCDHTSGYKGPFAINLSIVGAQTNYTPNIFNIDTLIHIGEVTGEFYAIGKIHSKQTWRVSEDGEIRDFFKNLSYVFEMAEIDFFSNYSEKENIEQNGESYLKECLYEKESILKKFPEIPFSNIWIAKKISKKLPENSTIHFGIFNSLRAWNFFDLSDTIKTNCNVGGFGIDGPISTLLGASLANPNRLFFGVLGDLAFFYDINALGNRHFSKNVRVVLINNGRGTEFRNYDHPGAAFGDDADAFISAAGHFGNKSKDLVRHYSEDLGFEYICASSKEEFLQVYERFTTPNMLEKPIIFEIFTNTSDESDALKSIRNIIPINLKNGLTRVAKNTAKQILGPNGLDTVKRFLGK